MYNTCMNNRRISKKDIENDLIQIFEKYPKSLEKELESIETELETIETELESI